MTREKGKIEWRTKKRLLYKDHKRIAGCKRHFTVKSSWVLKRKSTRLLVTLRQNEGCPSRGIPEVLLSWAFVVANVPENDIANGTHTHRHAHTRSHAHTHTHCPHPSPLSLCAAKLSRRTADNSLISVRPHSFLTDTIDPTSALMLSEGQGGAADEGPWGILTPDWILWNVVPNYFIQCIDCSGDISWS